MKSFPPALLASLCLVQPCAAQPFMMSPPAQLSTDLYISNMMIANATSRQISKSAKARGARADIQAPGPFFATATVAERASIGARLAFTPDPQQRAARVKEIRSRVIAASPADANLISPALFDLMAGALEPYDLSVNDLADTTSVYLGEIWDAANGTSTDLDARTIGVLADQMRGAYAALARNDPAFSDASLVQQQSDTFLLQAYLIATLAETYRQPGADPEEQAAFRAAMRGLGREVFGIDLAAATLGERGLVPGEALGALEGAVREEREARAVADPEAEAKHTIEAALATPCGRTPEDALERKVLRLFESKDACDGFDPAQYARFLADTPPDQHYAINYAAYATGKPLFPAAQAKIMDGMIE